VRLRAESRQSDGQAPHHVQTVDPRPEADPVQGRMLRAEGERRADLVQARNRELPRRAGHDRRRRQTPEV